MMAFDPLPLGSGQWEEKRVHKELRVSERGLYPRLFSIEYDALQTLKLHQELEFPLFGNARAGAWYVPPQAEAKHGVQTCSFKSADGHYGQWNCSIRRANIPLLRTAMKEGGVVVVDVTRSGKKWPDSFTKTIPIWCAVVNVALGLCDIKDALRLHMSVPESERGHIEKLLPKWVQGWKEAGIEHMVKERKGMLRAVWTRPGRIVWERGELKKVDFVPVICVCAGEEGGGREFVESREEECVYGVRFESRVGGVYVRGAGDDEEAWSKGLTPEVFWKFREEIMQQREGIEERVKMIVERESKVRGGGVKVFESGISVLNVGENEVKEVVKKEQDNFAAIVVLGAQPEEEDENKNKVLYISMNNRHGKTDHKYALGRALGPALSHLHNNITATTSGLIICTSSTGEWSAAIAIAWLVWHCTPHYTYTSKPQAPSTKTALTHVHLHYTAHHPTHISRKTLQNLTRFFLSPYSNNLAAS